MQGLTAPDPIFIQVQDQLNLLSEGSTFPGQSFQHIFSAINSSLSVIKSFMLPFLQKIIDSKNKEETKRICDNEIVVTGRRDLHWSEMDASLDDFIFSL